MQWTEFSNGRFHAVEPATKDHLFLTIIHDTAGFIVTYAIFQIGDYGYRDLADVRKIKNLPDDLDFNDQRFALAAVEYFGIQEWQEHCRTVADLARVIEDRTSLPLGMVITPDGVVQANISIDLKDAVDNMVHQFLSDMQNLYRGAAGLEPKELEWNIEHIGNIRDEVRDELNLPDVY